MKLCGTCRHFKTDESYIDCGSCVRIAHAKGDQKNVWADDLFGYKHVIQDKAVCTDGSDYHAAVICKADFGCVLHEEKT